MKLLLVGATGLVGSHVLNLALKDPRITAVVAPCRRTLPADPKLFAPLVDYQRLPEEAEWWEADAIICTLGTTMKIAGSKAQFRLVDFDYPLSVARLARKYGTSVYVLNSAIGANASSAFFYNQVKGELENKLRQQGFTSLTFVRPGLIGGQRKETRPGERIMIKMLALIGPILPRRWRLNPPERIASSLLEAALEPRAGINVVPAERMI